MYRETEATLNKSLALPAQRIYTISPIDADQIPNGYLKTVKVSVTPLSDADTGRSYMIVASTNDDSLQSDDYITAGSLGRGGGTVWLNLKRPVKSSVEEPNRPDGEVFIHILCSGATVATPVEVHLAGEVWGRFLNLQAN